MEEVCNGCGNDRLKYLKVSSRRGCQVLLQGIYQYLPLSEINEITLRTSFPFFFWQGKGLLEYMPPRRLEETHEFFVTPGVLFYDKTYDIISSSGIALEFDDSRV